MVKKLGAVAAYLLVGLACGFAGYRLGIGMVRSTPSGTGSWVPGLIVAGGVMAFLTGIIVPAPDTRPIRLMFLGFCTFCVGITGAGFAAVYMV